MDKQMMFIYGKGGKTMKNIIELRGKNMGYLWKINENYGNINGKFWKNMGHPGKTVYLDVIVPP